MVLYPKQLDVLMPLLDGWTPISTVDLEVFHDALRKVEEILGYGPSFGSTNFGPAGGNASVAARLDKFLELDGGLKDVAFVTGSAPMSRFAPDLQLSPISFGKTMSRNPSGPFGHGVMFATESPSFGASTWSNEVPANWWVRERYQDGVVIHATKLTGSVILGTQDDTVNFGLLVFSFGAFYP
jgi:hypothetical protein